MFTQLEIVLFLQQTLNGLIMGTAYGVGTLGLGLIYGIFHVPNMAHGAVIMIGAFMTLMFVKLFGFLGHYNYLAAIITAMVVVAGVMVLSDFLVFKPLRKRGGDITAAMIASIGVEYFLINMALNIWKADPRNLPVPWGFDVFRVMGLSLSYQRVLVLVVSMITVVLLSYVVMKTKYGKAMRACSQDMVAAKIIGINTEQIAFLTFALCGVLAALAGGLLGPLTMVYPSMGDALCTKAFAIVILGGGISSPGVMIGGIVLGVTEAMTSQFISPLFVDMASFLMLILVLLFRPAGLFGKTRPVKV